MPKGLLFLGATFLVVQIAAPETVAAGRRNGKGFNMKNVWPILLAAAHPP
jgi:hypothetical protein